MRSSFERSITVVTFRTKIIASLFLLSLVSAIYWPALNHEFLHYDDNLYVTGNDNVLVGLCEDSVLYAFASTDVSVWHPITWLSHMADVQFFGLNPTAHHAVNLIFHTLNYYYSVILSLALAKILFEAAPTSISN